MVCAEVEHHYQKSVKQQVTMYVEYQEKSSISLGNQKAKEYRFFLITQKIKQK